MLFSSLDFIHTPIGSQIKSHEFELQQSIQRHSNGIGVHHFNRQDPGMFRLDGKSLTIIAIGMLYLSDDIPRNWLPKGLKSSPLGVFQAFEPIKETLADRIE